MKIKKGGYIRVGFIVFTGLIVACNQPAVPKPRGYFRIEFPDKTYTRFQSECKYSCEIPTYSKIVSSKLSTAEKCWYNLDFTNYNATIYLTYKPLVGNLSVYAEDIRKIVYKHIIKADDIIETSIYRPENRVYGILYDIKGNTASSVNFFITDSTSGFLSGSLYFDTQPNKDSLAPAINYFREDIVHLINTFEWD
jgi:gliding motility-associated lipoprotein GldD